MLLQNFTRKVKNLPRYTLSKIQRKPFHWTMTQKQLENKSRAFNNRITKRRKEKKISQERRNLICAELERIQATNSPKYKKNYQDFCLNEENVNVNEVNLNALERNLKIGNQNSYNLNNLPLKPKPVEPLPEPNLNLNEALPYTNQNALNNARRNIKKAIKNRKVTNLDPIKILQTSNDITDMTLAADYLQMLDNMRRQRVARMQGKRGGKTRKH